MQAIAFDHRATGLGLEEHRRIHGREIVPPVQKGATLDPDIGRADDHPVALPLRLEYGTGLANDLHRLIDAERATVLARRQVPALFGVKSQRQRRDRLHRRQRATGNQQERKRDHLDWVSLDIGHRPAPVDG
ncbi:hypothetical protein D3C72_1946660 [compost metagenome]